MVHTHNIFLVKISQVDANACEHVGIKPWTLNAFLCTALDLLESPPKTNQFFCRKFPSKRSGVLKFDGPISGVLAEKCAFQHSLEVGKFGSWKQFPKSSFSQMVGFPWWFITVKKIQNHLKKTKSKWWVSVGLARNDFWSHAPWKTTASNSDRIIKGKISSSNRVVDLAPESSRQTLEFPIFRSIGTICGFVSKNV